MNNKLTIDNVNNKYIARFLIYNSQTVKEKQKFDKDGIMYSCPIITFTRNKSLRFCPNRYKINCFDCRPMYLCVMTV